MAFVIRVLFRLLAPPFGLFFEIVPKFHTPNHVLSPHFGFQLSDWIASDFLLLALFGKQIDYLLSVYFVGHTF